MIPVASALSLLATGYDLAGLQPAKFVTGNTSGTCPECGSQINQPRKTPEK